MPDRRPHPGVVSSNAYYFLIFNNDTFYICYLFIPIFSIVVLLNMFHFYENQ